MKELSIEEKAKRYDEVLNKLRRFIAQGVDPLITRADVQDFFPELKESKDEWIWKTLIKHFEEKLQNGYEWAGIPVNSILAWLEKQGEHKKFRDGIQVGDQVTRNEDGELVNLSQLNRVAKKGEQKFADKVEPKFKVGDVVTNKKSKDTVKIVQILHDSYCYSGWDGAATVHSDFSISEQDEWELVEQKPVEWSEEDDKMINSIAVHLNATTGGFPEDRAWADKIMIWLKSLKERVLPQQQEWSKEDELHLKSIESTIEYCITEVAENEDAKYLFKEDLNWLKSLRPQKHL